MPEDTRIDFDDRSPRLIAFGILSVLLGAFGIFLGLLHLAALLFADSLQETIGLAVDVTSFLMGFLIYVMLGATFIWIGRGSMQKRRWVPPMMTVLARIWLLCGLVVTLFIPGLVDATLDHSPTDVRIEDAAVRLGVKAVVVALAGVAGVLLPALFLWAYGGRDVKRTCEAHDPQPDWTESSGLAVLGLSVGLVTTGALLLPLMFRPVVPLFGVVVTGWPAGLLLAACAVGCLYLARAAFRLQMTAWWGSMLFVLLVGVSTIATFLRVAPVELYRHLGYPEESLAMLEQTALLSRPVSVWGTIVLTLFGMVYMAGIRKHFTP